MAHEKFDIVISGGGVAGLIAAVAFGNAGFTTLCVDPTPPITNRDQKGADLRTTAFLQPGISFLQRIGVWPHVSGDSAPLQIMRIADAAGDKLIKHDFNATDISDMPFGRNVGNWAMRAGLLTRLQDLPNVDFRPSVASTNILTATTHARVRLSDATTVHCKMLIAADGRDSPTRQALGINVKRTTYDQKALSFAVNHPHPHSQVSIEVHKTGGPFTLVPLPDYHGQPSSAVVWMDTAAHIEKLHTMPIPAFNDAATLRSAGVLGDLTLVSGRSSWPIISQIAKRFYGERTALIAETAHVVPPIGAQGLNLSLGDIEALLDLAVATPADIGSPAMLLAYQRARRLHVRTRVAGVAALNRASISHSPIIGHLRAQGLNLIHRVSPIRKTLMRMGLGAH